MKAEERRQARILRRLGWSLREIAEEIDCSKGTISVWIRDIPLTDKQIERLESKQARGRALAANHYNGPKKYWARIRAACKAQGMDEISGECSRETLKLIGAALYWAEGYKRHNSSFCFGNSDPAMIALMMRFLREVCKVPEERFRGVVHIHPHLNALAARNYWSHISGIPLKQFHQTQFGISKASKGKRDTLPLGTFRIHFSDVRLRSRMDGWIEGIGKWSDSGAISSVG